MRDAHHCATITTARRSPPHAIVAAPHVHCTAVADQTPSGSRDMSASDISVAASDALADISALRDSGFTDLASNGIKKSVLDDFETFLIAPGTLSRPSLIVRCQIANGDWHIRVIVDKPISQWRLSRIFLPLTRRLDLQYSGPADFFVLI